MQLLILADLHTHSLYDAHASPSCLCFPACANSSRTPMPFGQAGCDAPVSLVEEMLSAAAREVPAPSLILLLGDLVAHHAPTLEYAREVFANTTARVAAHFPSGSAMLLSRRCAVAIGNNDVHPDYSVNLTDPSYYSSQASAAAELCDLDAAEVSSLSRGGYYSASPLPGLRVLTLNTDVYSTHFDLDPERNPDPLGQFAWLYDELRSAADATDEVLITGHIPPALDSFFRQPTWQPEYAQRFYELVGGEHAAVVAGLFFGHLHSDQFRIWGRDSAAGSAPPLTLFASVSPIFGNNPAFYRVELSGGPRGVRPTSIEAFAADMASAEYRQGARPVFRPLYNTSSSYNLGELSNRAYARLSASLAAPPAAPPAAGAAMGTPNVSWEGFYPHIFTRQAGSQYQPRNCTFAAARHEPCTCEGECQRAFLCLFTDGTSPSSYEACLSGGSGWALPYYYAVPAAAGLAAVLAALVTCCLLRRRSRRHAGDEGVDAKLKAADGAAVTIQRAEGRP